MQSSRVALGVMLLLLVVVLASGLWIWGRLVDSEGHRLAEVAAPSVIAGHVAVGEPTPTPLRSPPGYRLAGVAVGVPDSFAVVEAPNGMHALYRTGANVPGLGKIVRIEAERVEVEGATGRFELWLAPAPTPTMAPTRAVVRRTTAPAARTPTAKRLPPLPPAGGRAGGSTP